MWYDKLCSKSSMEECSPILPWSHVKSCSFSMWHHAWCYGAVPLKVVFGCKDLLAWLSRPNNWPDHNVPQMLYKPHVRNQVRRQTTYMYTCMCVIPLNLSCLTPTLTLRALNLHMPHVNTICTCTLCPFERIYHRSWDFISSRLERSLKKCPQTHKFLPFTVVSSTVAITAEMPHIFSNTDCIHVCT